MRISFQPERIFTVIIQSTLITAEVRAHTESSCSIQTGWTSKSTTLQKTDNTSNTTLSVVFSTFTSWQVPHPSRSPRSILRWLGNQQCRSVSSSSLCCRSIPDIFSHTGVSDSINAVTGCKVRIPIHSFDARSMPVDCQSIVISLSHAVLHSLPTPISCHHYHLLPPLHVVTIPHNPRQSISHHHRRLRSSSSCRKL